MEGLPVAFCLLPNKRGKTYTALIEQLKEQANIMGKQFDPKRIVTDYEPGLMPILEQEVSILYLEIPFSMFKTISFLLVS